MELFDILLPILIGVLIILVIFLIGLVIKLINTVERINGILDDVNRKLIKVDGLFDLIDKTTDCASNFSDKIVSSISNTINKIFRRKVKGNDDDE